MKLAAAQTNPKGKTIEQNIGDHLKFVEKASEHGVQLITFPEMSLTGYQREEATNMAFSINDGRLKPLKDLAQKHQIILIAGASILIKEQLHIGSFILFPDGTEKVYTKQYLHDGEEIAFAPSFNFNPTLKLEDKQISLAICADITHQAHLAKACELNSDIYMPSIFYTPSGIDEAYSDLSNYAKQYNMNILMSNFCGESYDFEAAGKSAFWNNKGELVRQLGTIEDLLIIEIS